MYPELGHRPLNRLGVSNRAYFLEKSVPYLGAAISAGVVGLGPLLATMGRRNRNKRARAEWSEVSSSGNLVPTPAPTAANVSNISNVQGDTTLTSDVMGNTTNIVHFVGAETDKNHYARVYLGSTRGWKFMPKFYRRSKLFRNPITVYSGDNLSTSAISDTIPSYIVGAPYTNVTTIGRRNFDDTVCTLSKANAIPNATLEVTAQFSNQAVHFCFPVADWPLKGSNSVGTQRNAPFSLQDLLQTQTNLTGDEYGKYMESTGFTTGGASAVSLMGPKFTSFGDAYSAGVYVSYEQNFTIHNNTDYSQTYELYYLTPRKDSQNSPLYDYVHSWVNSDENISGNNAQVKALYHPTTPLFRFKGMRDKWRCIKKKIIQVAGNGTVKVSMRVPLSLVKSNIAYSVAGGDELSFAGLTGWFYLKAYGFYGYDAKDTGPLGTTGKFLGYAQPKFLIAGEQKVTVLPQMLNHKPVIDLRNYPLETLSEVHFRENDENATTYAGTALNP